MLAGLSSFKYGFFIDNDESALPGHHWLCRGVIPFITISKWRAGRAIELKYSVFIDNDESALPGHHWLCRGVIPFITISKWRAGRAIEL
ncbi:MULTISPECIES: hypothetical protein [unclassified Shewanella]|uniref:hypothetical protein n=1 Tax=Shewanella TaxID=22 RepID=UPI00131A0182|nr:MULTISPECIES: hypothetical protein [unclassified Shewanella]MCU8031005.1 hypothetical protein [Shewanella sp. SM73]